MKLIHLILAILPAAIMAEDLPDCHPDATGRFKIDGTEGSELKFCEWAARENTEERCAIEKVAWQCPVTCNVPCKNPSGAAVIAGANVALQEEDTIPETIIVSCVVAGIALIALIAYFMTRKKDNGDDREVVDEESLASSLGMNENENNNVAMSMSGEKFNPAPITVTKTDSVQTQELQQKGTFGSCCDPC